MMYLHESPLRFHGSLCTSNCLIDSRWVVKLSDFGLQAFKRGLEDVPDNLTMAAKCQSMLNFTAVSMYIRIIFVGRTFISSSGAFTIWSSQRCSRFTKGRYLLVRYCSVRDSHTTWSVRGNGTNSDGMPQKSDSTK